MKKYGAKWMLCVVIGGYCFAVGIGTRFGLTRNPHSQGIYIAEYLFVVLSPCAFLAGDYILLGRLARYLDAGKYMLIKPELLMKVFVASDVATFLIQACGGSLLTSHKSKLLIPGQRIFLAGLALQMASFFIFTVIFVIFMYRVWKNEPELWDTSNVHWNESWKTLAAALSISCVGILIRSVYRTAELSEGFYGRLSTDEGLFYGLDTYPLIAGLLVFVLFWPGRFIREDKIEEPSSSSSPRTSEKDESSGNVAEAPTSQA